MKYLLLLACIVTGQVASAQFMDSVEIVRYYNSSTRQHRITTQRLSSWQWQANASWRIEARQNDAMPLFECLKYDSSGSFLSTSNNCEGANYARPYMLGYIRQSPAPGYLPLFRCNIYGVGHYASTDSNCENYGQHGHVINEGHLGFVRTY